MSWLSELRWSTRLEHLYAMIAGEAELDETVPSTYDRKQGFLYKIAQKIQGGSLPDASEASEGDVLTIDDGEPVWAAGGGGNFVVTVTMTSETVGTADKSSAEIAAALAAGQNVFAFLPNDEMNAVLPLIESNTEMALFGGAMYYTGICLLSGLVLTGTSATLYTGQFTPST